MMLCLTWGTTCHDAWWETHKCIIEVKQSYYLGYNFPSLRTRVIILQSILIVNHKLVSCYMNGLAFNLTHDHNKELIIKVY